MNFFCACWGLGIILSALGQPDHPGLPVEKCETPSNATATSEEECLLCPNMYFMSGLITSALNVGIPLLFMLYFVGLEVLGKGEKKGEKVYADP